jgi:hypothetical protein
MEPVAAMAALEILQYLAFYQLAFRAIDAHGRSSV